MSTDTLMYTPLDSLKEAAARTTELIDMVRHDSPSLLPTTSAILENIEMHLADALGRHIPGITWDRALAMRRSTPEARAATYVFDDGSPVICWLPLNDTGSELTHFPRSNGDAAEHVARIAALHARDGDSDARD